MELPGQRLHLRLVRGQQALDDVGAELHHRAEQADQGDADGAGTPRCAGQQPGQREDEGDEQEHPGEAGEVRELPVQAGPVVTVGSAGETQDAVRGDEQRCGEQDDSA